MKGLVIKNTGSWYTVKTDDGNIVESKIKGNFRLKGIRSTNQTNSQVPSTAVKKQSLRASTGWTPAKGSMPTKCLVAPRQSSLLYSD